MTAGEWRPTPQLRWCVGVLQQAWTRECSEWRPGGMRGMVHDFTETEWRNVRQATDEEIAAMRERMPVRASSEGERRPEQHGHDSGLRSAEVPCSPPVNSAPDETDAPLLCGCDDVCIGPDNVGVAQCRAENDEL